MSELSDLEDTLKCDPPLEAPLRDKARHMRASEHFGKRLRQRLEDDFNDVLRDPPE